jgi:aminoglycoside phosphotransferase (APT) family kinase protein
MLAGRSRGEVVDVEPPERVSGGFDFWVYGLHFGGSGLPAPWAEPLIARIPAVAARYPSLQQESRILSWVAAQGYPAPPMVELMPPGELFDSPVQVMRRLAGITMAQAMTAAIDWTDAGIGDRHGDIARTSWLFSFAAVVARSSLERLVLRALAPPLSRAYLSAYRRELPVDPGRLRLWMPLQLLHAWTVAVAGEQGFFGPSGRGSQFSAQLAGWAERQFRLCLEDLP